MTQAGHLTGLGEALAELALSARYTHPDDLPATIARCARPLGARDVVVHIVDLGQRHLVPLRGRGEPERPTIPVEGTLPGRVYQAEEILHVDAPDGGVQLWLPLQDSAERLGVVTMTFDEVDPELERAAMTYTCIVAEYVVTKSRYGDALEHTRRLGPLTLAAEMRWSLLPPLTYHSPSVTVSGLVEPSYGIAGDSFDYAILDTVVHLALFDAVGHGLLSCRATNLAVSAYRNRRRAGDGLEATYRALDEILVEQLDPSMFVATIVATLDLEDGVLRWINGGQPPPLVLRGVHVVGELALQATLPAGLQVDRITAGEQRLQPGDTVVLFTDGVTEARSEQGEFFGVERLVDFVGRAASAGATPPETLRRLVGAVMAHQRDRLQDDMTVVLLTWHGPPDPRPSVDDGMPTLPT